MLEMDARNNIAEVTKASQFGLNKSIRGLAVVGIAAIVFVAWGIRINAKDETLRRGEKPFEKSRGF